MPDNTYLRRVWATLRLGGENLDPDEVTERLGITPTYAHRRGQVHNKRGDVWREGQWSLTSENQHVPCDLEDHIAWVLDRIEPVREQFLEICIGDVSADMFCFLECYGMGGPQLSPTLMKRMARLDLPLGLDIYVAALSSFVRSYLTASVTPQDRDSTSTDLCLVALRRHARRCPPCAIDRAARRSGRHGTPDPAR